MFCLYRSAAECIYNHLYEALYSVFTGPGSTVGNMSGNRCNLTADPGVASSIQAQFIFWLFKLAQEKVWLGELTVPL